MRLQPTAADRTRRPERTPPGRLVVIALVGLPAALIAHAPAAGQSGELAPPPIVAGDGEGRASLHPASFEVSSRGTYVVRLEVGPSGILPGGGVLVDFPKSWFVAPGAAAGPEAKRVQLDEPDAAHWLGARAARPDVRLELALSHVGPEGETDRLRHLLWIRVLEGTLHPGSHLEAVFAGTTAPTLAGTGTVRLAVDSRGAGAYRWLGEGATYLIRPGPAESIRLFAPSQAIVGHAAELRLVAFDRYDNVAQEAAGLFTVTGLGEEALALEYGPADHGILRFRWSPPEMGWAWPEADGTLLADNDGSLDPRPVRTAGGPIQVLAAEPEHRLFWGDLRADSRTGPDAGGSDLFSYARDAAGLDFLAATGRSAAREHDEPGRFAALLGYDSSSPEGHHAVVFRGLEGAASAATQADTVEELWRGLQTAEAITVSHHLGIAPRAIVAGADARDPSAFSSTSFGQRFDWRTRHEPRIQPLLEIYSGLGQSELYDPGDPLSAESVTRSAWRSIDGPYYARDAWASGLEIGVTASSGDHARPGVGGGLTAVVAPALTREAIFDALAARRTYATTGERVVLDFTVSDAPMGGSVEIRGPADGSFTVAAPTPMRYVEVVAYDHRQRWWTAARWKQPGRSLSSGFVDSPELPTLYLLRVELEAAPDGRIGRAWSSPVWVRPVLTEP